MDCYGTRSCKNAILISSWILLLKNCPFWMIFVVFASPLPPSPKTNKYWNMGQIWQGCNNCGISSSDVGLHVLFMFQVIQGLSCLVYSTSQVSVAMIGTLYCHNHTNYMAWKRLPCKKSESAATNYTDIIWSENAKFCGLFVLSKYVLIGLVHSPY